jgi:hypothetical protein
MVRMKEKSDDQDETDDHQGQEDNNEGQRKNGPAGNAASGSGILIF